MLVESVRQCLARRQVLLRKQPEAQNHRLEGLQRSSRLTRSNGTPRLLDQEKFLAGLDRTDGPRDGRSELENAAQAAVFRAEPLRRKRMDGPRGAI